MRKNRNNSNFITIAIITVVVVISSISIIFSLATITTIEPTYANHIKYHLNNSLVDVTISSDGDIPDALLEDIKRNIMLKAEEKKAFGNNNSQVQTKTIENTSKAKIILTGQNYIENEDSNYDDINGQVKNIGNGTAESIKTTFTFYEHNMKYHYHGITQTEQKTILKTLMLQRIHNRKYQLLKILSRIMKMKTFLSLIQMEKI